MVRIGDKIIPDNKNAVVALTYVYGVGKSTAKRILKICNILFHTKNLNENQVDNITRVIREKGIIIEGELRKEVKENIEAKINLGTYEGRRLARKPNPLPLRSRTRHNAQTAKKGYTTCWSGRRKVTAVAGKKKAPTPK